MDDCDLDIISLSFLISFRIIVKHLHPKKTKQFCSFILWDSDANVQRPRRAGPEGLNLRTGHRTGHNLPQTPKKLKIKNTKSAEKEQVYPPLPPLPPNFPFLLACIWSFRLASKLCAALGWGPSKPPVCRQVSAQRKLLVLEGFGWQITAGQGQGDASLHPDRIADRLMHFSDVFSGLCLRLSE